MKTSGFINNSLFLLLSSLITLSLYSQDQTKSNVFVPHVGQPGKDVIWVPTPPELVEKMLEIAGVTEKDYVIDLGSGDGRTVIAAAKLGARAVGIEYNPDMVKISNEKAEEAGVSDKTKFFQTDLFEFDLSEGTVITMFLLPDINLKLRPKLLNLKPGTRIVSNTFTMGEWEPDYEVTTESTWDSWHTALMWIIPAKFEGKWNFGSGVLTIHQQYQMIYGSLDIDGKTSVIKDSRINGDIIIFNVNKIRYTGKLSANNSISGTETSGSVDKAWIATFAGPVY